MFFFSFLFLKCIYCFYKLRDFVCLFLWPSESEIQHVTELQCEVPKDLNYIIIPFTSFSVAVVIS